MLDFNTDFINFTSTIHHDTYPPISTSNHKGTAVLITGASRGIGRAIATSFAAAGATSIGLIARTSLDDTESQILSAAHAAGHPPPKILKLHVDTTDPTAVQNAVVQLDQAFEGRLDILVNNAGVLGSLRPMLDPKDDHPAEWWRCFEVNIRGTYLVTRAFMGLLLRRRDKVPSSSLSSSSTTADVDNTGARNKKTIIIMSSIGALMRVAGMAAYQMTKFALLRFADFVMNEYGHLGVLAFCMHPGAVDTSLTGVFPEDQRFVFVDNPRLCGDTIAWLTEKRRDWLAGRLISANWDMIELEGRKEEIIGRDKLKMKMVF